MCMFMSMQVWSTFWTSSCYDLVAYTLSLATQHGFIHHHHTPRTWYHACTSGLVIVSRYEIVQRSMHIFQQSAGMQVGVRMWHDAMMGWDGMGRELRCMCVFVWGSRCREGYVRAESTCAVWCTIVIHSCDVHM